MVTRLIRIYEKIGDDLLGEITLEGADLMDLQAVFNENKDDPMYDSYPVKEKEKEFFENKYGVEFDFGLYDHFLEADAE